MSDLLARVLADLIEHPDSSAKEIGARLGVNSRSVYAVLHSAAYEGPVKFCKPVIRGLRTRDGSPYALGKWEWAARCIEHDTSWTTGPHGVWHEALSAAITHQWEWAEVSSD